MNPNRIRAHGLLDRLSERQLSELLPLLEQMLAEELCSLETAPDDDEPESRLEREAVRTAREELSASGGHGIGHGEAMRRLGLSGTAERS